MEGRFCQQDFHRSAPDLGSRMRIRAAPGGAEALPAVWVYGIEVERSATRR